MRHRHRTTDETEVDMTPMLDIVFIMLIFFIVTAVFLDEDVLDFTTPPNDQAPTEQTLPVVQVYLSAQNLVMVDGQGTALDAVTSRVETAKAQKPDAQIIVRVASEASLNSLVSIKDDLNAAGHTPIIKVDPSPA